MATTTLIPLSGGHFTLPLSSFISPCPDPSARATVPSLSFLITHTSSNRTTRLLFDLGLRRSPSLYSLPIQQHIQSRQPFTPNPDVVASLKSAVGLEPGNVDCVVLSHVHWDHVGLPSDFPHAVFVVGNGALDLLSGKISAGAGSHSHFEPDLFEGVKEVVELTAPRPPTGDAEMGEEGDAVDERGPVGLLSFHRPWRPHPDTALRPFLLRTIDVFDDGELYVVDAPGHLPGHINLLVRVSPAAESDDVQGGVRGGRWMYLAGDAAHDRRILRGEAGIAEWDVEGGKGCIHFDKRAAEETIKRIRGLVGEGVEVVLAHDGEWERDHMGK